MTKIADRIGEYRAHAKQCRVTAVLTQLRAAKEGFILAAELWEGVVLVAEQGEPLARDLGEIGQSRSNQVEPTW